jgi:uncharacterized protein (TIGR02996 family)
VNEYDAMVAAIQAQPGDDARLLVLADWLQERGHDSTAAWLREHVAAGGDRGFVVQELRRERYLGGPRVIAVETVPVSAEPIAVAVLVHPAPAEPRTVRVIIRPADDAAGT